MKNVGKTVKVKGSGYGFQYQGTLPLEAKDTEWGPISVAPTNEISGRLIGSRKIYGMRMKVIACSKCSHTFYAI